MPRFDEGFPRRLGAFHDELLPWLKGRSPLVRESPAGSEISPEPDSPRGYSPGDDARAIDWTLYARLDRLYLRTMTREEEIPLLLLLDTSASMGAPDPRKLQRAAEVAAAVGDLALALGHAVYLAPWADGLGALHGPYRGEPGLDDLLAQLARVESGGGSSLRISLRALAAVEEVRGASAVLISDFLFPLDAADEILHFGRGPLPPRVLQLLTREEAEPSLQGNLVLLDPEGDAELPLTGSYRLTRRLRELVRDHLDATESLFLRAGARFVCERAEHRFEQIARMLLA
ncbi:MAG: DUF58 domain-containing protein [Candidatus Methylomirabilia bacterium]